MSKGKLYICGTPIGNIKDITIRCLEVLKGVDKIVCEDTRQTIKLLNFYGIKKKLMSYHEHNKRSAGQEVINLLEAGENIAMVSDAGMPCISDPGCDLVALARENLIDIEIIPGPTAFTTAIALSGLDAHQFIFEGFISADKKERRDFVNRIKFEERLVVIYEAPHHLLKTLQFLNDELGTRNVLLIRELTKIHEELFQGTIEQAINFLMDNPARGEYVILLCGVKNECSFENMSVDEHINFYLQNGYDLKQAIKNVARDRKCHKNDIYSVVHRK